MHLFQLFANSSRWLVMQYKVSSIDVMCNPKDGLVIWLWKYNNQGCPKLPSEIPKPIPFCPIWGNDASKSMKEKKLINNDISKYLEFWKLNIVRNEMYAKAMPYIEYGIFKSLLKPLPKQNPICWRVVGHLVIGRLIICNSLF